MRGWILAISVLMIAGCTTVPEQLQGTYPSVSPLRVEASEFGSTVRWGGVIIDSVNSPHQTCFEVLSRDLDKYLRPRLEDRTAGRFIACKAGFYDPEVFARGREVTLVGRITAIEVRNVDEFEYHYPVVNVDELVLWEVREEVVIVDNLHHGPYWHPYYWHGPYWGYYPFYRPGWPMYERGYVRTRQLLPDPADLPEDQ